MRCVESFYAYGCAVQTPPRRELGRAIPDHSSRKRFGTTTQNAHEKLFTYGETRRIILSGVMFAPHEKRVLAAPPGAPRPKMITKVSLFWDTSSTAVAVPLPPLGKATVSLRFGNRLLRCCYFLKSKIKLRCKKLLLKAQHPFAFPGG